MSSDKPPPVTPVVTPSVASATPNDGRFDGFSPALVHILREVFDVRDTDPIPVLVTALHQARIRDMYDFIDAQTDYEANPYTIDPSHDKQPRPVAARSHMTKVITLQAYLKEQLAKTGNPEMVDSEWLAFTNADYRHFRNRTPVPTTPQATTTTQNARSNTTSGSSSTSADVLFKKGICRDPACSQSLRI